MLTKRALFAGQEHTHTLTCLTETCRALRPLVREIPCFVTGTGGGGAGLGWDVRKGTVKMEHPRRGTLEKCQKENKLDEIRGGKVVREH